MNRLTWKIVNVEDILEYLLKRTEAIEAEGFSQNTWYVEQYKEEHRLVCEVSSFFVLEELEEVLTDIVNLEPDGTEFTCVIKGTDTTLKITVNKEGYNAIKVDEGIENLSPMLETRQVYRVDNAIDVNLAFELLTDFRTHIHDPILMMESLKASDVSNEVKGLSLKLLQQISIKGDKLSYITTLDKLIFSPMTGELVLEVGNVDIDLLGSILAVLNKADKEGSPWEVVFHISAGEHSFTVEDGEVK